MQCQMYVMELHFSTTAGLMISMYLVKPFDVYVFPMKSMRGIYYSILQIQGSYTVQRAQNLPRQLKVYQQ